MLGKKLQKFACTSLTKAQTAKGKDANLSASFVLERYLFTTGKFIMDIL